MRQRGRDPACTWPPASAPKEAVAKALGLTGWSFRDVEVVATDAAPLVRLSGRVADRAAALGGEVSISLTHTGTTAGAVALVGRPPG